MIIVAAAKQAGHLTVFPALAAVLRAVRQRAGRSGRGRETKKNFDAIWQQVRNSVVAFGFQESGVEAMSVSEQERRQVFQENWDKGNGFRFMFGTFCDIATNPEANAAAATFVRSKIKEIVQDPETARKLTPTDLYAKRPLCNEGYYERFNRDNVYLVVDRGEPDRGDHARRGAHDRWRRAQARCARLRHRLRRGRRQLRSMDLRGRGGRHINEGWAAGPSSYLGVSTHGFPNMFMILGPNGPFTNLPPSIESQVEWIADTIRRVSATETGRIEVKPDAETEWTDTCVEIAGATVFGQVDSWIFGANVPGKKRSVLFYLGGLGEYRKILAAESAGGYPNFVTRVPPLPVGAAHTKRPSRVVQTATRR